MRENNPAAPAAAESSDVGFGVPQTRRAIAEAIRNALIDDGLLDALREEDTGLLNYRHGDSGRTSSGTLEYPRMHVGPMTYPIPGHGPVDLPQVEMYFVGDDHGWPVKIVFQTDIPSPGANPELTWLVCTSAAAFLAEGELGGYTHTAEPFPLGDEERNGYADVGIYEADELPQAAVLVAAVGEAEYIADVTVVVGNPLEAPFPGLDFRALYVEARRG